MIKYALSRLALSDLLYCFPVGWSVISFCPGVRVQGTQNRPGQCLLVDVYTITWTVENQKEELSGVSIILKANCTPSLLLFLLYLFHVRVTKGGQQT